MVKPIFYIAGTAVKPPQNWLDMLIEMNYGKDQFPDTNTINVTNFDWVGDNYKYLTSVIENGKTGDVGITEGVPFKINLTNGIITKTVLDGYIDLTRELKIRRGIRITAKATNFATVDWLNQIAGSFTFEYLSTLAAGTPGAITTDYYKPVPYVNSKVPDYEQAAMVSLMAFQVTRSLIDAVEQLYNLVAEIVENWSDIEITEIIKLFLELAYIAVLLIALVKLSKQIISLIVSPVKYHMGMYVIDSIEKAVEYISEGKMTFVSDIWEAGSDYENEFIIPPKQFNAPASDGLLGFLAPDQNNQLGYYKGTFADLLEGLKKKYNAKIIVSSDGAGGGTIFFVRRDKNIKPAEYALKPYTNDDGYESFSYNADELAANYSLYFQTDNDDQNTLQDYYGTMYQVITSQKKVNYQPFVMLKNSVDVPIPFAKAVRKKDLTNPEQIVGQLITDSAGIFSTISDIANTMIGISNGMDGNSINDIATFGLNKLVKEILDSILNNILGANSDFTALVDIAISGEIPPAMLSAIANFKIDPIGDRVGMMLLSSDHFSVAKILILNESSDYKYNRIHPDNETRESAKAMWDKYHYVNSFIPASDNAAYSDRPTGNQFLKKTFTKIPFTFTDFLSVLTNNNIKDEDGQPAVLESLKFNPYLEEADISCRFPRIFTTNIQETFLNPTGA